MIYTFYSYKGGVGRSMALANVAEYFYRKGLRVIIIDWDLEAPGLESFYFNTQHEEGKETLKKVRSQLGLMDLLLAYKDQYSALPFPSDNPETYVANPDNPHPDKDRNGQSEDYSKLDRPDINYLRSTLPSIQTHMFSIHSPGSLTEHPDAALSLMQAGWREGERFTGYTRAVQGFDWVEFYVKYKGKVFFEWMREELESCSDVILIDSRTGVTEMGGVCTQQLANIVVCCSVLNSQNMEGVARMIRSFTREELRLARDNRPISSIAVPTRIDTFEIDARATLFESFEQLMGEVPVEFKDARTDYEKLAIPYVGKYAYLERLAIGANDRAFELENAYKSLATHLVLFAPEGSPLRTKLADDLDRVLRISESPVPRMAPPLPSVFIERPAELDQLRDRLITAADRAAPGTVVVSGAAGYGKSIIAAAFADEGDVVNAFKDGILWVTLGAHPDLKEILTNLYVKLASVVRTFVNEEEATKNVATKLHGKKCLIVIDDLCNPDHLAPFDAIRSLGSLLVTTRDGDLANRLDLGEVQVGPFTSEQALEFVRAVSRFPSAQLAALSGFVQQLPPQPLILKLAGDMLRQQIEIVTAEPAQALDYAARLLAERGLTAFDKSDASDRNQSVARSVEASLGLLSPEELERYIQLAFMLDKRDMTITEVMALWNEQEVKSDDSLRDQLKTEEQLQRLNGLSLIEYNATTKRVKLDRLLRSHLLGRLPKSVGLHLKAENIFSNSTPEEQSTMQRVLPLFVKLGRDSSADTRARVRVSRLEDARGMVAKLTAEGILVEEEDKLTKERKVLFANDSLIEKWARLREWINSDREFLLWMQQIRPTFEAWKADPRYGVLHGDELAVALDWKAKRPGLDQAVWAYVTVSQQANRNQQWKQIGLVSIVGVVIAAIVLFGAWRWYESRKAAEAEQRRIELEQRLKETAASRYQEALAAINHSEYATAIGLLNEALQYAPERAEYYNARGNAYSQQQNYTAAISDFDHVLQLDPNSAAAYFNRGLSRQKSGDNSRALSDFTAVLGLTKDPQLINSTKQQIRDISKVPSNQTQVGWAQYISYNSTTGANVRNFEKTSGDPNSDPRVGDNLTAVTSVNLREVYVEQDAFGNWIRPTVTTVAKPQQTFNVLETRSVDGTGIWFKLQRAGTLPSRPNVVYYSSQRISELEIALKREGLAFSYGGPPSIPNVAPDVRYYYHGDQDLASRVKAIIEKNVRIPGALNLNPRMNDPDAVKRHSRGTIEVWLDLPIAAG